MSKVETQEMDIACNMRRVADGTALKSKLSVQHCMTAVDTLWARRSLVIIHIIFVSVSCISTQCKREARALLAIVRERKSLIAEVFGECPAPSPAAVDFQSRSKSANRKLTETV
jgi:hypothetical protein